MLYYAEIVFGCLSNAIVKYYLDQAQEPDKEVIHRAKLFQEHIQPIMAAVNLQAGVFSSQAVRDVLIADFRELVASNALVNPTQEELMMWALAN
jgi:hypothetical protein